MNTTRNNTLNNPKALLDLECPLLVQFLRHFKQDLDPKFLPLLDPNLPATDFYTLLANLFADPDSVPAPLRQALAAIDDLAAPENSLRLDSALDFSSRSDTDLEAPPFRLAVLAWVHNPYQLPVSNTPSANPTPDTAMPPLTLKLHVLFHELHRRLLRDFVHYFKHDLIEAHPDLPPPSAGDNAFVDAVYPYLTEPDKLIPRLYNALLAIQQLAAPENHSLLLGLRAQCGLPAPEAETSPEHIALEYWLRCPVPAGQLDRLRAQLPAEFLNPPPANPNGQPPPPPAPTPLSGPPGDFAAIARYPRYKITHLPPEVRLALNQMLRRRVPYAQIIEQLGPQAQGLNKSNLSRWKKTGYLLWLAEQQRREDAQDQLHLLFDLVREDENGKIHEATQQIAALRISQVLAAFDPVTLTAALQQEPQAFVRLVQTLPTLSRGGLDAERLLLDLSQRKAKLKGPEDPDKPRILSERTQRYVEQKLNLL